MELSEAETANENGAVYSINGSTLVIHGDIESVAQLNLNSSEREAITKVTIENNVSKIIDGSLSGFVKVTEVTAPYIAFKDRMPAIFGLQDYPKCEFIFMEGEYKHLVICTDVIKPHSSDRSIKSIVISSSCSSFPMNVFTGCTSLETVRIDCPNLKSLSMNAFKTCTSLTDVCLPDNITSIARSCFSGDTALQNVYTVSSEKKDGVVLPDGVNLVSNAFEGCSSIQYAIIGGESMNNLNSSSVFKNCTGLKSFVLREGVKSIGSSFFEGCTSLEHITFPSTMTSLSGSAFKDCKSLKDIDFNGCQLTSITGSSPFQGCNDLQTTVVAGGSLAFVPRNESGAYHVPDKVTSILNYAFSACDNMTELYLCDTLVNIFGNSLSSCSSLSALHDVPIGLTIARGALEETAIKEEIVSNGVLYYVPDIYEAYIIGPDIRSVHPYAFYANEKLESVVFQGGAGDLNLGEGLFMDCKNLRDVQLPKDLTFIYTSMFSGCVSLESIDLTGITYIYSNAFMKTGLKSVTVPATVTTLEEAVFRECTALADVVFENPDTLFRYMPASSNTYSDAKYIFYGCKSLANVSLPANLTAIPQTMFQNCTSLESIELPKKLQTIGQSAFSGAGLKSMDVPEGVYSIGVNAFSNCTHLERISLPSTLMVSKFSGIDSEPMGNFAFRSIGKDTEKGADVTIRGCPLFGQSVFRDAKINDLIIESAPDFKNANVFDSSTINNIVVFGGSAFKLPSKAAVLSAKVVDGRMPVKLQNGTDGFMLCSLADKSVLSIGPKDVAISATLLDGRTYTSVSIDEGNSYFSYIDDALYFHPNGGSSSLAGAELVYVNKTAVSDSCFIVPSGVASIGSYAFSADRSIIDTVVLPDSVESLDVLSMQNVTHVVIDSLKDTPTFGMYSTMKIKVFFDYGASSTLVDSLKSTPSPIMNSLETFGGYFLHIDDDFLLVQILKDSATLTIEKNNGIRLSLELKGPYSKSEYKLIDGSEEMVPESDGSYLIPQFQGSKLLSFKDIVLNQYALTTDADSGVAVSYSLLNTDSITHGTRITIGIVFEKGYESSGAVPSVTINGESVQLEKFGSRYVFSYDVVSDCRLEIRGIKPIAERTVTFLSGNSTPFSIVKVVSGYPVSFPGVPTLDGQTFKGWYVGDELFDFFEGIVSDVTVEAKWVSDPVYRKVVANADNGAITIKNLNLDSIVMSGESVLDGTRLLVTYRPIIGFEAHEWIVNGVSIRSIECERIIDVDATKEIHVTSEYTLSSYPYLETDIKAPSSLDEYKMIWKAIGTKGYNGMVFTPSILGDYVYSWSGTEIFKIDLFTGEIVKKVDTGKVTSALYYNMVTVGNGYVLAGFAGQVYDADLNPVFRLYLDKDTPSSELKTYYNEGYFYVFTGSGVFKFSATDSDPDSNNIQLPVVSGSTEYTHYISWYQGQSNLIFTDRFVIGLEFDGDHDQNRYMVTYDIDTLKCIDSYRFDEIESANLNTGYISYYDGTAYFNTYSPNSNMFSTASGSWNSMASIDLGSDGVFDPVTVRYYSLGTTSYPSSLIVVGDYGYINAGTYFRVIDMKTMDTVKMALSQMSHGNMTVSVQGEKVYAYIIPYNSSTDLRVFEHDQKANTLKDVSMRGVIDVKEYSSQIVHFGPHGEILYYNDSGYLFCVAPVYTASFVSNGGSDVGDVKFTISDSFELPVPKKDGFRFVGWYDNPAFEGAPVDMVQIGSFGDRTYYAKYIVTDDKKLINSVTIEQFIDGGKTVMLSVKAGEDAPEKVLVVTYSAYVNLPEGSVLNPFLTDIIELTKEENVALFSPKDVPKMESVTVSCCYEIDSILYSTPYVKAEVPIVYGTVDLKIDSDLTLSFDGTAIIAGDSIRYGYYIVDVDGEDGACYKVNDIVADGSNRLFYYGQSLTVVKAGA